MITTFLPDWVRRGLDYLSVAISAILISGCAATGEPEVRTVTVKVPVQVACLPSNLKPAPAYPDTVEALRSAVDAAERYLLLFAGHELREARLNELETVVKGCETK